ncbi:MAG: hypothetical protein U0X75_06130 [Acidobacteriota bacterium]
MLYLSPVVLAAGPGAMEFIKQQYLEIHAVCQSCWFLSAMWSTCVAAQEIYFDASVFAPAFYSPSTLLDYAQ